MHRNDQPSRTLVGISTSVLPEKGRLSALLESRPDVVEWYAMPRDMVPRIERFTERHGIRSAVHAPMPFDGSGLRFGPTSHDPAITAAALSMTLESIELAHALDALHVVVHFPDPEPPYVAAGFQERARSFLDRTADAAERWNVTVVLENMTPNPLLRSPEHYRALLDDYPGLALCFDIGHAHLAEPDYAVGDYIAELGDRIFTVHVYNTTAARYPDHGHEPIAPDQTASDGFFDWERAVDAVLAEASPAAVIVEHDHRYHGSTRQAVGALRERVAGHVRAKVAE